jgi:hypothetical protein
MLKVRMPKSVNYVPGIKCKGSPRKKPVWCTIEATSPGVVLQFSREVKELFPRLLKGMAGSSKCAVAAVSQRCGT